MLVKQFLSDDLTLFPLTIFLAKPGDELLRWYDAHFPLLVGNTVKQVSQAGEQVLLPPRLTAIRQDLLPERSAEVQSLQHRVAVAGVSKLKITYGMQSN